MRNKIEDLRNHMFASLEKLAEAESPEDMKKELERSKGIAELSKVIIESAKVEVDFVRATNAEVTTSDFFNNDQKKLN
jgi:hypothetical protein